MAQGQLSSKVPTWLSRNPCILAGQSVLALLQPDSYLVYNCVCEKHISNSPKNSFIHLHLEGCTGLGRQVSAAQQTCWPPFTQVYHSVYTFEPFSINLWGGHSLHSPRKGRGERPLYFFPQKNLLSILFYNLLEFLVLPYWGDYDR